MSNDRTTLVIGAGIIGASIAYHLAAAGEDVTVIDAAGPAAAATGASFGWLNASFFADHAHFRLRQAGLEDWAALKHALDLPQVDRCGALWWEEQGAGFDSMRDDLRGLGYAAEEWPRARVMAAEPFLAAPPERALYFADEGIADPAGTTRALLRAAAAHGARMWTGLRITAVTEARGRATGVRTAQGHIPAARVVIAAGTGAPGILETVGGALPMLQRPGLLVQSRPVAPCLSHVIVTPGGEVRQDAAGRIVSPAAVAHQQDSTDSVTDDFAAVARTVEARLNTLLTGPDTIRCSDVALGWRPVPADGLPVIGQAGPEGLYLAVMHSGITLAAVTGRLAAAELTGRAAHNESALLAPYRPARFA